jgi:histidinol-phosphate/aromatic aminotransferase/cobyric acid decarboxylase-like protein
MGQSQHLSRRAFGLRTAALTAGGLEILTERAYAQRGFNIESPADAVLLNANENPLGPCPEAIAAMSVAVARGGRYGFGEIFRLGRTLAEQEGVPAECVQSYAGSSDPLHHSVLAFCSPSRGYVACDPTFESGERAARFAGAPVVTIPLTASYAHDVKAMVERAGPGAGLFYVCNPNNPTGTVTPREDLEWLVANKPQGSVVLLDEAYIHFSREKSAVDMVAAGKDIILLRTFSKIYGMAGLRAGVAIARPDLLEKIRPYGPGFLPLTGMVGATASLNVRNLVPQRRAWMDDIRGDVYEWIRAKGWKFTPGAANCFMIDTGRPGREVVTAMAERKVYIGRSWSCWPNWVRITIGLPDEMAKFKAAFEQVMA